MTSAAGFRRCAAAAAFLAASIAAAAPAVADPARYDAFLPGAEPPRIGYDLQAFDAMFPKADMWQDGFCLEAQLGACVVKYASLGIGFGLMSLSMDEDTMRDAVLPQLDTDQVDLDTVSIAGSTVAFTIGPSLWLQVFPASFMSVSVEAAARYAFFPITPNVEGEKEEEFGGQEIEIPMADSEPIEVDTVEYTREYSEDIDIDSALMGRLSLNVEVGRPGEMTAFLGAGWLTDLSAPLVRFKAAELGEFGLAGLTLRVGFRSLW